MRHMPTFAQEDANPWNSDSVPLILVAPIALLLALMALWTLSWKSILLVCCILFIYFVPVPRVDTRMTF